MCNHMNGAVPWEDHLYGLDDLTHALKCIDLAGNERWSTRESGGALTIAGGRLLSGTKDGELVVAEASPDGYRELARTQVLDGATWPFAPVLADGRIYMRDLRGGVAALDHRIE